MRLTSEIAMSIVTRTMKHLKYNINIMNEKGFIIGSGDPDRISAYHQAAYRVLEENKVVEIKKGDLEYFQGAREGVNLPIRFNAKPVGVVGITGNPNEVRTYGAMVQAMAELMLEEAFYWEQESIADQAKFTLVNDLIHKDAGASKNTLIVRANLLGYNLNLPRSVAVFEVNRKDNNNDLKKRLPDDLSIYQLKKINKQLESLLVLTSQDLLASGIGGRYVLIKHIGSDNVFQKVKNIFLSIFSNLMQQQYSINAGVGKICVAIEDLPASFEQALHALEVGYRLFGSNQIVFSDELGIEKLIGKVDKNFRVGYCLEILRGLIDEQGRLDHQLIETAEEYFKCDLKPGQTARNLFIHRNTLKYRIGKIKAKTGLDLNSIDNTLSFKMALMFYKYDQELL